MGVTIADSPKIIEEFLTDEDGELFAFLGGPYVSTPVAHEGFRNEHPAIIFHPETEGIHISGAETTTVFVFKCYGGTSQFADARAMYRALVSYLQNRRGVATSAGTIRLARLITAFQGAPDPGTSWPVMVAKFEVHTE